jgi:hypothetical protein
MNDSALASFAIPAHLLNNNNSSGGGTDYNGIVGCPLLTHTIIVAAAAVRTTVPRDHQPSLACSHDGNDGGGADDGALALLVILAHLLDGNGNNDGNGNGDSDSNGDGDGVSIGDGDGDGNRDGDGDGDSNDNGNCNGNGDGDSIGNGHGNSNGKANGSGNKEDNGEMAMITNRAMETPQQCANQPAYDR